ICSMKAGCRSTMRRVVPLITSSAGSEICRPGPWKFAGPNVGEGKLAERRLRMTFAPLAGFLAPPTDDLRHLAERPNLLKLIEKIRQIVLVCGADGSSHSDRPACA